VAVGQQTEAMQQGAPEVPRDMDELKEKPNDVNVIEEKPEQVVDVIDEKPKDVNDIKEVVDVIEEKRDESGNGIKEADQQNKVNDQDRRLMIGAAITNFDVETTQGSFRLHDWLRYPENMPWTLLSCTPGDFTPVCTTEMAQLVLEAKKFAKMRCKIIGVSSGGFSDNVEMGKCALTVAKRKGHVEEPSYFEGFVPPVFRGAGGPSFPIILDEDQSIINSLGLLAYDELTSGGLPKPGRAVTILHGNTVKFATKYPTNTGHNFDEIFRVLTSLQLTASTGLATPANWTKGERVVVPPSLKIEDAEKRAGYEVEEMFSWKSSIRTVDCPADGEVQP